MEKIKVAVIGCGTIAANEHIPAYMKNPGAEIKYFCDILPEKARAMADRWHCGTVVTDYRDILKDPDVTAVSVCTPNSLHAPITIDCLRAGKNVLCEKPAAPTYDAAAAMAKAQRESGRILNIGVVNRFNDGVNHIRDLIRGGELGNIYHVYGSFRSYRSIPGWGGWFTTKSVSGGGVLIDWGVHFLDLIMYCCGDPAPLTASAAAYGRLGRSLDDYAYQAMWAGPPKPDGTYDVEDFITGLIRTEGPTITLNGAWAQNIGVEEMYIDFLGDKAGIRLQYGADFKIWSTKDGMLLETAPRFRSGSMFQHEIDAFLDCIPGGKKLPSNVDTVLTTARIMQGLYDSARQKREVSLRP